MKYVLIFIALAASAFAVDAANDILLSQRKPDNSGNIQRNVPATGAITSGSLASFQTAIGLGSASTPTFGTVTAARFISTVATGTAPLTVASTTLVANLHAATADSAVGSTVTVVDDTTTNATMYPTWVTANTGNLPVKVSSTKFSFNPSTGVIGLDDGGGITSAGSIALTAGGSNKGITVAPIGTGNFAVGFASDTTGGMVNIKSRSATTTPVFANWNSANDGVSIFGEATMGLNITAAASGGSRPILQFRKASGTLSTPTAVANGDQLGQISASGYDGAGNFGGSFIGMYVDGTVTTGVVPSEIRFGAANFAGVVTQFWRLRSNGSLAIAQQPTTAAAWGATGINFASASRTATDSSTLGSGTVALVTFNSFNAPTLAASNTLVTATDAFNVYLVGPVTLGTNITAITRNHTLGVVDSTSAASSITGGFVVSTTLGTAATSVGIGGGNINAGGTLIVGGATTLTGALTQIAKTTTYNNIATAGMGVAVVVATPRQTAVTNTTATLATYTVPATDSTYRISANVQVTAVTTAAMTVVCTYTDETNTSRAQTLPFVQLAGTFLTSITNVTGTGPYESATLHIRCKAGTTIVFTTAGTVTGITYNIEGLVVQGS
jgi:hypothetical protein